MTTITRQDLVHRLAGRSGLTPLEAGTVVDMILEVMKRSMQRGERIEIPGFGAFSPHERPARKGVNPRSLVAVSIPAKQVPVFKPSPELTALINPKPDQS